MLLGIGGWILLGIIIGFIATKIVSLRGDDPRMGIAASAMGALVGGWLYSMLSKSEVTSFNPKSLMFAGIAAVVVLLGWHSWRWKVA